MYINFKINCEINCQINCQINSSHYAPQLLFVQYAHACGCAFLGRGRHHGSDSSKEWTSTTMCVLLPQYVVALVHRMPDRQRPVTTTPVASF